jgi:hypothetical protein
MREQIERIPMIKYQALPRLGEIEKVEIERETDHFVLIGGKTWRKTATRQYFDTFQEAKDEVIRCLEAELKRAHRAYRDADFNYEQAKKLTEKV